MKSIKTKISVSDHNWVVGWLKRIAPALEFELMHYDIKVKGGWETKVAILYEECAYLEEMDIMVRLQTGKTVFELLEHYVLQRKTPEDHEC